MEPKPERSAPSQLPSNPVMKCARDVQRPPMGIPGVVGLAPLVRGSPWPVLLLRPPPPTERLAPVLEPVREGGRRMGAGPEEE